MKMTNESRMSHEWVTNGSRHTQVVSIKKITEILVKMSQESVTNLLRMSHRGVLIESCRMMMRCETSYPYLLMNDSVPLPPYKRCCHQEPLSKQSSPQHTAKHFSALQHTATHCNTLQHTELNFHVHDAVVKNPFRDILSATHR